MILLQQSATIKRATPDLEKLIEEAGRVCYKSEDRITETSHAPFIARLLESQHESVIEHGAITVHFVCDRGITHELVRHRLASYSQESTRYCNYSKEKFNRAISFILPEWTKDPAKAEALNEWQAAMLYAEHRYFAMIDAGSTPQEARGVLPTDVKTEIVITANPREWRHIFKMRTANNAHPQMRALMSPMLYEFSKHWPVLFSDMLPKE